MKRILALLLGVIIILGAFAGCGKKKDKEGSVLDPEDRVVPTETIPSERMKTGDDFLCDYTVSIEAGENGTMAFRIRSRTLERTCTEWTFKGYYSEASNLVNYTGAVRDLITFDKTGKEKTRETEYDNGAGRIIFKDTNRLVWKSSSDDIAGSGEFERIK
ncbi:MAG: hypothetical protein IKS39_00800 [Clostridia bacterium]|nr:hypothetical protein [Clostridia bacterium]